MGELVAKHTAPNESNELYYILGVPEDATPEEIRKAYKKLANEHHPDKPTGDPLVFKLIKQAYEILIDPEKRQNYDATGIFDGEDAEKVKTARATVEGMIDAIIQDENLELEYIDIVSEIKKVLAHNIKQYEKGMKRLNKAIKRLNKYKKRAKSGLIRAVFDKNIQMREEALQVMARDKEVHELATKIVGSCDYEFDERPEVSITIGGQPITPFHIQWPETP